MSEAAMTSFRRLEWALETAADWRSLRFPEVITDGFSRLCWEDVGRDDWLLETAARRDGRLLLHRRPVVLYDPLQVANAQKQVQRVLEKARRVHRLIELLMALRPTVHDLGNRVPR
jgi:hypothetical protein